MFFWLCVQTPQERTYSDRPVPIQNLVIGPSSSFRTIQNGAFNWNTHPQYIVLWWWCWSYRVQSMKPTMPSPQSCPCSNPQKLTMLLYTIKGISQVWLSWGPWKGKGLSGKAQCNHRCPHKRSTGVRSQKEEMWALNQRLEWCALKVEEWTISQGMQVASRS